MQTGAIDDMHRAVSDTAEGEKKEEGKRIVAGIAALKYELQHDRAMTWVCRIRGGRGA